MINFKIIIEFDGKQHYEVINFGGVTNEKALENFNDLKVCDTLKNEFCLNNGYKMIRISYLQIDDIYTILSEELKECLIK